MYMYTGTGTATQNNYATSSTIIRVCARTVAATRYR